MMTYNTKMTLEELLDREAIRQCLLRYCRGIDRCDAEVLRTVYWEDSTDDHITWQGSGPEFIDWAMSAREQFLPVTNHMLGGSLFSFKGTIAHVETYIHAYHRIEEPTRAPYDFTLTGRYLDTFAKRGDEWRIQQRVCTVDSYQEFEANPHGQGMISSMVRPGRKKPDDLIYTSWGEP